jgi:hypothetical protein
MTDLDHTLLIDNSRAACLCDVGGDRLIATVAVAADGAEHLVLADRDRIGDDSACVDTGCRDAEHEQLGELPIEYIRRITASRRTHRCGRPTKSGAPCQTQVTRPGDACGWHRTGVHK